MSHAIMSSMQYYPEEIIAYAIMFTGRSCIGNRVHHISRSILPGQPEVGPFFVSVILHNQSSFFVSVIDSF